MAGASHRGRPRRRPPVRLAAPSCRSGARKEALPSQPRACARAIRVAQQGERCDIRQCSWRRKRLQRRASATRKAAVRNRLGEPRSQLAASALRSVGGSLDLKRDLHLQCDRARRCLGRARHRDGPRRLLRQDALYGLSELAKTHRVDIAPADAQIAYFEQHPTAFVPADVDMPWPCGSSRQAVHQWLYCW